MYGSRIIRESPLIVEDVGPRYGEVINKLRHEAKDALLYPPEHPRRLDQFAIDEKKRDVEHENVAGGHSRAVR